MSSLVKEIFVSNLKVKEVIESTFYIKYVALMESRDGRSYLNVILSDKTGDLEGRMWNNASELATKLFRGQFIQVKGKTNIYQGKKQFIIQEVSFLDKEQVDSFDKNDYFPKSTFSQEEMMEELMGIINGLDDFYIKKLIQNIFLDQEILERFKIWSAGKSIHHAYQSGLLEHTLSCAKISLFLSKHFKVNSNFLVGGAILHDISKIFELHEGVGSDYTDEGKLIGHIGLSLEIVDRFVNTIPDFPAETKVHLKHILLSHHGEYSFGSPKLPLTKEAYLFFLIDLMDSKMNALSTIQKSDNNLGSWSNYIKHLDRMIYKDDLPHFSDPNLLF